jgi:hypothetical protein
MTACANAIQRPPTKQDMNAIEINVGSAFRNLLSALLYSFPGSRIVECKIQNKLMSAGVITTAREWWLQHVQ